MEELEAFLRDELHIDVQDAVGDDDPEGVTTWMAFVGGGEPRYILNFAIEQPNPAYAFPAASLWQTAVAAAHLPQSKPFTSVSHTLGISHLF